MDEGEVDMELIELFYLNKLSSEDLKKFEERYKADSEFAKKVNEQVHIYEAVKEHGNDQLRNELKQKYYSEKPVAPKQTLYIAKYWRLAAVVLVLVAAPLSYYYFNNPATTEELYNNYFEPLPLANIRGSQGQEDEQLKASFRAYDQKDYQKAALLFEEVLVADSISSKNELSLYLSVCYIELNKAQQALPLLDFVSKGNSAYREDALWYTLMAHLQLDDEDQSIETVNELIDNNGKTYISRAEKIKSELE